MCGIEGMSLSRRNKMIIVSWIKDGSSASAAGIKVGDKLLSIDSTDAVRFSLLDVSRLCSEVGRSISIRVERDGHVIDTQLRLSDK
jgi:C-terminal processing protease CtpA/Prc